MEVLKKNYEIILWDIDDTLIDFKASEKMALRSCFAEYGVELSDEDIDVYSNINHNYWKLLEQGKVVKTEMLVQRFVDFIECLKQSETEVACKGVKQPDIDGADINMKYQLALGDYPVMYEDALAICTELKGKKRQYAVTNGTIVAQEKKLKNTGLDQIFEQIFISDEVGYQKPDVRFFQHCFENISDFHIESVLLIGDSLSSDMKGGNLAGVDCCWANMRNEEKPEDLRIDYEIHKLKELRDIL